MDDQWRQWTRELLQPDALTAPLLATLWREVLAFDTVLAGHVIDPVWVPSRTVVVAGSGKKTFKTLNVSTAASILAASCGAKTAKGVPRSVSAVSPLTYSTRSGFPWVSDSVPLTGNGGDTDRGTAANTVAFTPPGSALDALERPATGGELTAVTYRYRRMDADVASWRLIRPATSHLRLLDELHRDAPPATCRRGLAAAVSEAAGLAAWLCFD
ncbi:MAG: hypothetical protein ACRDTT_17260, partial [Pseudonocardiaceae bacterium]